MGIFDFDKFALKDIWGQIKDNPERLLVGAIDPWSTKMWNKVLGKDWEPMIDQMGGPYGGHTISAFGNQDGGVYQRAADAGIDTKRGGQMHDAAHIFSAVFGGQGLMGLGGGAPSGGNMGIFANSGQGGMTGVGGGNAGALMSSGGIKGGAGPGMFSGLGQMQPYLQAVQQMLPQQQPQSYAQPQRAGGGQQAQPIAYLPPAASAAKGTSRASRALQDELERQRIMEMMV